jgi:hypothetical protein
MAQDPEFDNSSDRDPVTIYESQTVDAEMEADMIAGVLSANGIPSTLLRTPVPSLGYSVQVPRDRVEDARRAIAEAQAAGPAAAEAAEAESEKKK